MLIPSTPFQLISLICELHLDLKRFSETRWSKLSNVVEFPTGERELNMSPYGANSPTVQYSLYGICNHMGKKIRIFSAFSQYRHIF